MKKIVLFFILFCILTFSIVALYSFRSINSELTTISKNLFDLSNDTLSVLNSLDAVSEKGDLLQEDILALSRSLAELRDESDNEYLSISERMRAFEYRLDNISKLQYIQNENLSSIGRIAEADSKPEVPVLSEVLFDNESAKAEALRVVEMYPNDSSALTRLGEISFEEGDLDSAAHYFEKVLELDPSNTIVLNGLGRLSSQMGDFDRSVYIFNRLTKLESENPVHYYNLSMALYTSGQHEKAKSAIEKSLAINRNSVLPLNLAGRILKDSGYITEAVEAYEKSLSIKEDPLVLSLLGDIHNGEKRYDKALDCWESALKLQDGRTLQSFRSIDELYGKMASSALQLKNFGRIENYFLETETFGGSEEVHYFYIHSLRMREDDDAVARSVRLFIERYPDSKYQSELASINIVAEGA